MQIGELYVTYPLIVKWLAVLKEHLRIAQQTESSTPNFSERVVQVCKDLKLAVDRCYEKLNEDAFIAALLDISVRDTFFTQGESDQYWKRLQELYEYIFLSF